VWQKANEINRFLKKFLSMRASKLVVKTNGNSVVSATRKTNLRVQIAVLGQIGVGRSLSSGDNIRCLDGQRSDFTVRWHLVGDRRAGDEPNTEFTTQVPIYFLKTGRFL
jgi:hypothetical protein